jgi:hypothetical protein
MALKAGQCSSQRALPAALGPAGQEGRALNSNGVPQSTCPVIMQVGATAYSPCVSFVLTVLCHHKLSV